VIVWLSGHAGREGVTQIVRKSHCRDLRLDLRIQCIAETGFSCAQDTYKEGKGKIICKNF
jgi:hypothetical protein